jgi:hypothetical protein
MGSPTNYWYLRAVPVNKWYLWAVPVKSRIIKWLSALRPRNYFTFIYPFSPLPVHERDPFFTEVWTTNLIRSIAFPYKLAYKPPPSGGSRTLPNKICMAHRHVRTYKPPFAISPTPKSPHFGGTGHIGGAYMPVVVSISGSNLPVAF